MIFFSQCQSSKQGLREEPKNMNAHSAKKYWPPAQQNSKRTLFVELGSGFSAVQTSSRKLRSPSKTRRPFYPRRKVTPLPTPSLKCPSDNQLLTHNTWLQHNVLLHQSYCAMALVNLMTNESTPNAYLLAHAYQTSRRELNTKIHKTELMCNEWNIYALTILGLNTSNV